MLGDENGDAGIRKFCGTCILCSTHTLLFIFMIVQVFLCVLFFYPSGSRQRVRKLWYIHFCFVRSVKKCVCVVFMCGCENLLRCKRHFMGCGMKRIKCLFSHFACLDTVCVGYCVMHWR